MGVTKQQIADRLNLDRSTVSKILNNRSIHNFNKNTVFKVYQTAREMGYDFSAHRRLPQRRSMRHVLHQRARVRICTQGGELYDEGEALVEDISLHGVYLSSFQMSKNALPLEPFTIQIQLLEGVLRGLRAECEIARIMMEPEFGLGLNFVKISERNRERIMDIL